MKKNIVRRENGSILDQSFSWGKPFIVYTLENIDIVGFLWKPGISNHDYKKEPGAFDIYIDGKAVGECASSLDRALIAAVARKYDGGNSQAAYYFSKMIGMDEE